MEYAFSIVEINKYLQQLEIQYPDSFSTAIITSPLSSSYFPKAIEKRIETIPNTFLLHVKITDHFLEDVKKTLNNWLLKNIEIDQDEIINNMDSVDRFIMNNLSRITRKKKYKFYFTFEYCQNIPIDEMFTILAQLRRIREFLRSRSDFNHSIYTIVIGPLPFQKLLQMCIDRSSSILEDRILFNNMSFADLTNLIEDNTLHVNIAHRYLFDITNGCPEIIHKILSNSSYLPKCDVIHNIYHAVFKSNDISALIDNSLSSLSQEAKKVILNILYGFKIKIHIESPLLHELFLSGLITFEKMDDHVYCSIRNWGIERIIRSFKKQDGTKEFIISEAEEIIPDHSVLNIECYGIILKIENMLRNLLINELSKNCLSSHPLKQINYTNKPVPSPQYQNYYQYCTALKNKVQSSQNISAQSSLSSYLQISDLQNILFKEANNITPDKGVFSLFSKIFPNRSDFELKIDRLREIRNPIAHNNIINETVLNELIIIESDFSNSLIKYRK